MDSTDAARAEAAKIRQDYDKEVAAAERRRARALAAAADRMPQKVIIEGTGYSRETVRRLIAEGRSAKPAAEEGSA